MQKIVIKKDKIIINDIELIPPFSRTEVDNLLGESEFNEIFNEEMNYRRCFSVWNQYGLAGYLSEDLKEYDTFLLRISEGDIFNKKITGFFDGEVYIEDKLYTDCKWKEDDCFSHVLKNGCFELSTFIADRINKIPEEFREDAIMDSHEIEISYIKPKSKSNKNKTEKTNEKLLVFSNFNFKLAVIQKLMYEKNLLQPKFNIYDFAKEYNKRDINIDEEGYAPIKEAVEWFNNIEIPVSLATEVDEIIMDGGNDIYLQIIPFWDGEDDYFDIKDINEDEVKQFHNLKNITLLPTENIDEVIEKFEKLGIQAEELLILCEQ